MDVGGRRASIGPPAGKPTNAQQADRDARLEMARLTMEVKATGVAPSTTARALQNLKEKFGDEAGKEALRKFNQRFQGYRPPDQYPRSKGP